MSIATSVPVMVMPDAAARVAELGHQVQLEQMIEQVIKLIPRLLRVEVILVPDYDEGGDPGVVIEALVNPSATTEGGGRHLWRKWKISTFPTDISRHYSLLCAPVEAANAG